MQGIRYLASAFFCSSGIIVDQLELFSTAFASWQLLVLPTRTYGYRSQTRGGSCTPKHYLFLNMFIQDTTQELFVFFHRFRRNTIQLNQFMVVMVNEVIIQIKYMANPPVIPAPKLWPTLPTQSTSHIFTAVVAAPSITAKAPELRTAKRSPTVPAAKFTASRPMTGITNNAYFVSGWRTFRWENRDTTTRHTFTHVVVRITFQFQMQTTGIPDTE